MYLLPNQHPAIKKILDGQSERCDIYTEGQIDLPMKYIDNFLRFVETHLNKIKLENRHGVRNSSKNQLIYNYRKQKYYHAIQCFDDFFIKKLSKCFSNIKIDQISGKPNAISSLSAATQHECNIQAAPFTGATNS